MNHRRRIQTQLDEVVGAAEEALKTCFADGFSNRDVLRSTLLVLQMQRELIETTTALDGRSRAEATSHSDSDGDDDQVLLARYVHGEGEQCLVEWPMEAWGCPVCRESAGLSYQDRPRTSDARPDPESLDLVRAGLPVQCHECGWVGTVLDAALAFHRDNLSLPQPQDIENARSRA